MLDAILEFFGVVRRSRYALAYETSLNLAREVDAAHEQLNTALRRVADVTTERDLHKRESSAHAKAMLTARTALNNMPVCTAYVQPIAIDGNNGKYELRLDIATYNTPSKYVVLRSLVANKRNKEELEKHCGILNTMLTPAPVATATSLLREATAAPATDGKFPSGNFKPKGFA